MREQHKLIVQPLAQSSEESLPWQAAGGAMGELGVSRLIDPLQL